MTTTLNPTTINEWADFWRYQMGVNIIPADTRNKIPLVKWTPYQNTPILEDQHIRWKQEDAFKDGMAIIAGKIWHNDVKKNLHLIVLDLDNQKAIDEFCTRNGALTPLTELAKSKSLIIEQHADQPDKAHIIFYAAHPFPKKSSDMGNLAEKLGDNDVPAIEVKGAGEHGILFCTPSPHKNGQNYEIVGNLPDPTDLTVYDHLEEHIDSICKKYNIPYLSDRGNGNGRSLVTIQDLFQEQTKIYEGHNRHEALLRVMESLLKRNFTILSLDQIKELAHIWNQHHCVPPLENSTEEQQWKDAIRFIHKSSNEEKETSGGGYDDDHNNTDNNKTASESERKKTKKKKSLGRVLSVSEAARLDSGLHTLRGNISGISELYHVVTAAKATCANCGLGMSTQHNPPVDYSNYKHFGKCPCGKSIKFSLTDASAVTVELRDSESFNDLDKIRGVLLNDNTYNIPVGENVLLTGEIAITEIKGKGFSVMYGQSIRSEGQRELKITPSDRKQIKQFAKRQAISDLVSLTIPNIIGHETIKEGILLSAVSSREDKPRQKRRIHILLIGPPGVAKTEILGSAIELIPGSTFQSGQSSTGLSLTALVVREDDKYMLRIGPIPKARGKICAINEINRQNPTDQDKILDFMQEGQSNPNKYGISIPIRGPTTIIASANPRTGEFSKVEFDNEKGNENEIGKGKIDLNEVDLIRPLRDRFDLIYILKRETDPNKLREYAHKKGLKTDTEIPGCSSFLQKYIMFAKQIEPKVNELAKSILNECYVTLSTHQVNSPRTLETLYNLARARARLKLHKIVDEIDAKETVDFYSKIIQDYHDQTITSSDPRDVAVSKMEELLESSTALGALSFRELVKSACESDNQVSLYLGDNFSMNSNRRLRSIAEMLQRNPRVKVVKNKPLTLQWISKTEVTIRAENMEAM